MIDYSGKVSLKAIYLRREVGSLNDQHDWIEFKSVEAANMHLFQHQFSFSDLGYDQVDFKIVWVDGTEYSGCLTCISPYNKHYAAARNRVNDHVIGHLQWMINEGARTGYVSENDIQNAKLILDKYKWC